MKEQLNNAVANAYIKYPYLDSNGNHEFIGVGSSGSSLTVKLQDGAIGENGINGIQLTDLLCIVKDVYKELNASFPCRENSLTITKIEEAIHWQDARTKDRESRGVEVENKA